MKRSYIEWANDFKNGMVNPINSYETNRTLRGNMCINII